MTNHNTLRATFLRAVQLVGRRELARRLGVTETTVQRWIAGYEVPTLTHWLQAVDIVLEHQRRR